MTVITVIDYGAGNLLSVVRALRHIGADVRVTEDPDTIIRADHLVLPGVGAFGDCMKGLTDRKLIEPIHRFAETGRPFLGICVGMQIMMDEGEEFGLHAGLGLVPGRVVAIPGTDRDGDLLRIPHIGWDRITAPEGQSWTGTCLETLPQGEWVYFVHSFAARPDEPSHILAESHYGGHSITAAIRRDNLTGCQFHPEKSGAAGLSVLATFVGSGTA